MFSLAKREKKHKTKTKDLGPNPIEKIRKLIEVLVKMCQGEPWLSRTFAKRNNLFWSLKFSSTHFPINFPGEIKL